MEKLLKKLTRNILNEINAFIFILDVENLKPLWVNNYFKTRMGYSIEDVHCISKEDFLKLFHPKSLPIFLDIGESKLN